MLEAWSLEFIKDNLEDRLGDSRYANEISFEDSFIPIGILLARPKQELTQKEILPHLDYYHHRSGDSINFYCGGYGRYWYRDGRLYNDAQEVSQVEFSESPWLFSPQAFVCLVEDIERETSWKYSGGIELLLFNTWYEDYSVVIDFENFLSVDLSKACNDKVVPDIQHFFEEIFHIARNNKKDLSVKKIKKSLTIASFSRSAKESLFKLIPNSLGEQGKKAIYFTTFGKALN
jgi:hypothetical protein